jgi:hypothetical protein
MSAPLTNQVFIAFLRTEAASPLRCWEWRKGTDKDGYGRTRFNGKNAIAHRAAYQILVGPIPAGMCLLHNCDNPACCNPAHLLPGTQKLNYEDARQKGRASIGERNGMSRLTLAQVRAIRNDTRRQVDIAADYGIQQSTVSAVKIGQNWSHAA